MGENERVGYGMLEKIFIISVLVFAINYTMKEGEIFGIVNRWFANLNERLKSPLIECPVCQAPWYGSVLYWLIWGLWLRVATWQEWLIVVIAAMGLNAILVQLFPKDE